MNAYKVSLIVEVRPQGISGCAGVSLSSTIVGENYDGNLLAARAVKQYREARSEADDRMREKREAESKQEQLFT
jgi:hypothetical protein